jgi:ankyrin repeat protein
VTDLIAAIQAGNVREVGRILDRDPLLVETTVDDADHAHPSDTTGMTLLHVAVAEDQAAIVRLLLERGADPNVRNGDGRRPIHDCFELGRDALATILTAAGAEIDVCAAAAFGRHDKLRALLAADPDQANDMTTHVSPLGWAAYAQDAESARILCAAGAVVDRPPFDQEAWGPAAAVGAAAVARVLLEKGADPDWQDDDGNTPLHRVLQSRLVVEPSAFVEVLVQGGADRGHKNRAGHTPLDEARAQTGVEAESYFPRRTLGAKRLEAAIAILSKP